MKHIQIGSKTFYAMIIGLLALHSMWFADSILANPRDPAKADAIKMAEAIVKLALEEPEAASFPAIGDYDWIAIRDEGDYVVKGWVDTEAPSGRSYRNHYSCWLKYTGGDPGSFGSWELGRLDLPDTTSELWYAGLLTQESKSIAKDRESTVPDLTIRTPSYQQLDRQEVTFHGASKLILHVQVKVGTPQEEIRMLISSLTKKYQASFDIICVHVYTSDIAFASDDVTRSYQACCMSEWITRAKGEPNYPVTTEDFYEDERFDGIAYDWRGEFGNTPLDKVRKALYEAYQKGTIGGGDD